MIYLLHHAQALGPEVDPQRPLSAEGRAHAEQIARTAAARGVKPDAIWHSGKLRARQTGEPLWRLCNPLAEFAAIRGLQPDDPPHWIRDLLVDESRTIVIVGHMPHLPRLLTLLTTGQTDPMLEFPLHAMIALEAEGTWWKVMGAKSEC
jgi:phosphohistidine phosphatase